MTPTDPPVAHVAIDIGGNFVEFDAGAEHVFGHRAADVLGQRMSELIVPEALRQWHEAGMRRYLATGEEFLVGRTVEITALRADGTEFPIEITIRKEADDPVRIGAVIRPLANGIGPGS